LERFDSAIGEDKYKFRKAYRGTELQIMFPDGTIFKREAPHIERFLEWNIDTIQSVAKENSETVKKIEQMEEMCMEVTQELELYWE
jgi:hypothetical protein